MNQNNTQSSGYLQLKQGTYLIRLKLIKWEVTMAQDAKQYIAEALLQLMEKKDLKEIHIKDLVAKAGVSRMSYYRYFSSKEEILQYYMKYILERYMNTVEQNNANSFHSYEHILQSLLFFQQYKHFALCLHKAGMDSLLLDALNDYIRKQPAFDEHKCIRSYPFYFYAGALYNIFMQWILHDTVDSAEDLAQIIARLRL